MNNYKNKIKTTFKGIIATALLLNTAFAQAPANDDPCNAIPLTVNQTCSFQSFTNANATGSTGVPAPGCASYSGGDVWFTITVPPTGSLTFETQSGVVTDGGMALYSGTCSNLTFISCDDDGGTATGSTLMPLITETTANLVPGSTIWIRFWEYGNNNNGTFSICVSIPPPPPACTSNQPAGNTCAQAPSICNLNGYCGNTSSSYTVNTWGALTNAFCGSIDNNSFITFVASGSTASFNVWVSNSLYGDGIQMMVYSGGCGSGAVTSYGCDNQIYPTTNGPTVFTATGLTPGRTYYLMFDGFGGDVCDYVISPIAGVDLVNVTPSNASICPGDSVQLSATGGNGSFTWSGPGINSVTGSNVTVHPTTTSTYNVTSTSLGSCPLTQNVVVTVNTPPSVTSVQGVDPTCSTLCDGSATVVASGTAPLAYTWTNSTGTTSTISNLCAGSYSVTVTDANGCSTAGAQAAVVTAPPAISLPTVVSPVDYCLGATVTQPLQATGSNLLWYTASTGGTGSINAPTPTAPVTAPSTFYVSQTVFGCESPRAPVNVTVSAPSFSIDAGGPYSFQLGVGGQLNPSLSGITSGQLSSILWTPSTYLDATNILNPNLTPTLEGTYTYYVVVSNALGCTAIDSALVYVVSECIKVHNAFSPNGDGINELWEVYASFGCLKNVSVNVYNRYGSKVYENKDYRNNWDGTYKAKPVPDGTYYAVIEFELISGKKIVTRTDVTVIR